MNSLFSPNLIAIIATDISDRVAIEDQLKKSERHWKVNDYRLEIESPINCVV